MKKLSLTLLSLMLWNAASFADTEQNVDASNQKTALEEQKKGKKPSEMLVEQDKANDASSADGSGHSTR